MQILGKLFGKNGFQYRRQDKKSNEGENNKKDEKPDKNPFPVGPYAVFVNSRYPVYDCLTPSSKVIS